MLTETEVTFVRIYLHEADHGRRRNLMREIMAVLEEKHRVRGITVFRGIAGAGDNGEAQAGDLLRLVVDLPVVVEFYESPESAAAVMKSLADLLAGHPVVSWPARLTHSRPAPAS